MKLFNRMLTKVNSADYFGRNVFALYRCHAGGRKLLHTKENSQVEVIGNAGADRAKLISKAMKLYLEKAKNYDTFIENEIAEFEIGKRHLANIMGVNVDNFTQDDIDNAIEYLLPSGLFDKKARPKLKHPLQILPRKKVAQFGNDGRPFSSFFYTIKSAYTECLYNISLKLESLKKHEDEQLLNKIDYDDKLQLKLTGSKWLESKEINNLLDEQLNDSEYKNLLIALDRLTCHPYSYMEKDFIFQFRNQLNIKNHSELQALPEMKVDDKNREYFEASGKRKTCEATVKLYPKGSGIFTINGISLLRYLPKLIDREQVLNPLNITGNLRSVDIIGETDEVGSSCQVGALRLAISRALQGILPPQKIEQLRLAGLLQQDLRRREREKPGQKGARAKYTWKKR